MLVVIKGAGDIATGIASRLKRAKFDIIMTDIEKPTSIRRTVCFSQAIVVGETIVEGIKAQHAKDIDDALCITKEGNIAVLVDENAECINTIKPKVVIDAILAKKNLGTKIDDAEIVIAVGPGFRAKKDCDVVIETMRGHTLGRVIYDGEPIPNTNVPGLIGGYAGERVLRAPIDGTFREVKHIGDTVEKEEIVALVDDEPICATISGILRGILPTGTKVHKGMKSGDIDPRCIKEHCYTCSDKALAIGGGVLEAILSLKED